MASLFGHTTARLDIELNQGSTWRRPLAWTNASGAPLSLVGCTIRGEIRKNALDTGTPVVEIACTITDGAGGLAELLVTDTQLAAVTTSELPGSKDSIYWYDLEIVWASGDVERWVEGKIQINREVTK